MNIFKNEEIVNDNNILKQNELLDVKGGQGGHGAGIESGDGWITSISGECTKSGKSCWTGEGLADWIIGN